jgi:hypothetical protein
MAVILLQIDQLLLAYLEEEEEELQLIQQQCPKVVDIGLQIGWQASLLLIGIMEAEGLMAVMVAMAIIIKQGFYISALQAAADRIKLDKPLVLVVMVDTERAAEAVQLLIMVMQVVLVEMVVVV